MWMWVAIGGGLGALARYELAGLVQRGVDRPYPAGTFVVNVSGSFLLGVLTPLVGHHPRTAEIIGAGVLGGFTTFSTWMVETEGLGRGGGRAGLVAAALNLASMLAGGLIGFGLGVGVAQATGAR